MSNITSDFTLIEERVNYYLNGLKNNDIESARKAFHKTAKMKFTHNDGKYVEVTLSTID